MPGDFLSIVQPPHNLTKFDTDWALSGGFEMKLIWNTNQFETRLNEKARQILPFWIYQQSIHNL